MTNCINVHEVQTDINKQNKIYNLKTQARGFNKYFLMCIHEVYRLGNTNM